MATFKRSAVIFACVFAVHFFSEWEVLCSKGLERVSTGRVGHANFVDHSFHFLNVSKILTLFIHGIDECLFACLRDVSCFSFNVAAEPDDGIGHYLCELLASDKYNASGQFVPNPTFHHYSIHTPCAESPCLNGGSCIALYRDNDFKCKCLPTFSGRNCGKVIDATSCKSLAAKGHQQDGIHPINPDGSEIFQVFCDMASDNQGWTLVARFSNNDSKIWMNDTGYYWYDRRSAVGQTTNPAHNADMISRAFWAVEGTEIKITRSDDSSHTALLQTTSNCLSGQTFRSKLTSYGDFREGGWASDQCLGSCDVQYGGQYNSTDGFQEAQCDGQIQTRNKVGFWCHWSADGAVMMIGGGGSSCDRADHGIGITEDNSASFIEPSDTEFDFGYNPSQGGDSHQSSCSYALNLWVR